MSSDSPKSIIKSARHNTRTRTRKFKSWSFVPRTQITVDKSLRARYRENTEDIKKTHVSLTVVSRCNFKRAISVPPNRFSEAGS